MSLTPTPYQPNAALNACLKSIRPENGAWPLTPADWAPMLEAQEKGADLVWHMGTGPKKTLFWRLAEKINAQSHAVPSLSAEDWLLPLKELHRLTEGQALGPQHWEAWSAFNTSYSSMCDPKTKQIQRWVLKTFIDQAEEGLARGNPPPSALYTSMLHRAFSIDSPALVERLWTAYPNQLRWGHITLGGPEILIWLLGQDLDWDAPMPDGPEHNHSSLHDRMMKDGIPMCKLYREAKSRMDLQKTLEASWPQPDSPRPPRPRM